MRDEDRYVREAHFHDQTFSTDARGTVDRAYGVLQGAWHYFKDELGHPEHGGRALEYGCGEGSHAFLLARRGWKVTAIDISEEGLGIAKQRARAMGVDDIEFRLMNAEQLEFADGQFDLVCGSGILHHLDLARAYAEIGRVLTPSGHAVFVEPLAHNPLLNLFRRLTPDMRSPDEHPLRLSDLQLAERHFAEQKTRFFGLASLLALPFVTVDREFRLTRILESADRELFRRLPAIERFAWATVITLRTPRAGMHPQSTPADVEQRIA